MRQRMRVLLCDIILTNNIFLFTCIVLSKRKMTQNICTDIRVWFPFNAIYLSVENQSEYRFLDDERYLIFFQLYKLLLPSYFNLYLV